MLTLEQLVGTNLVGMIGHQDSVIRPLDRLVQQADAIATQARLMAKEIIFGLYV